MNLNEAGSVRLVRGSGSSVCIAVRINGQFFYMNEMETLELIQGIVVKSLVDIEENQHELQNYFEDEFLHSSSSLSSDEKETRISTLTRMVEKMKAENEDLRDDMKKRMPDYEEDYKIIFSEFEKLSDAKQTLLEDMKMMKLERESLVQIIESQNKRSMYSGQGAKENENPNRKSISSDVNEKSLSKSMKFSPIISASQLSPQFERQLKIESDFFNEFNINDQTFRNDSRFD